MLSVRHIAVLTACAVACAWMLMPAVAVAQDYDLNFTLPTAGKSGCMVCHGDPNLGRLQGEAFVSYYVDATPLDEGPHAAIMCTGCHLATIPIRSRRAVSQRFCLGDGCLSCNGIPPVYIVYFRHKVSAKREKIPVVYGLARVLSVCPREYSVCYTLSIHLKGGFVKMVSLV